MSAGRNSNHRRCRVDMERPSLEPENQSLCELPLTSHEPLFSSLTLRKSHEVNRVLDGITAIVNLLDDIFKEA